VATGPAPRVITNGITAPGGPDLRRCGRLVPVTNVCSYDPDVDEAADPESAEWLQAFTGAQQAAARTRLHALLLRIARGRGAHRAVTLQA